MVYLCIECPDRTELCSTLMALFGSSDFDFDSTISYKTMRFNWQIHSVALESIVNKFIELPTEKIFENCLHDILIVQKAAYLRETKASLNNETCIILMNFAENFSFPCSRCVYWQNQVTILHSFAVYKVDSDGKFKCDCFYVVSD